MPLTPRDVEALYRRFAPLVHARAQRLVGDEAEDVLHEVFLRLLRAPPREDALSSWIYVTTTHACLDRLRARARRDERWYAEARDALAATDLVPERIVEAKDACRRLVAIVEPRDAAVATMVFVDEMTQDEAAHHLGVTRTAVAKRLHRFLAQARRRLAG